MRIGLDGRFWSEEAAGIARYSRELVKNLLKIDKKNEYFLFLLPKEFKKCKLKAKNLNLISITSPHYSLREQAKLPLELAKIKLDFIHFLNFYHPFFWKGRFLVTVHDLTLFFYPTRRGKTFIHQLAMKLVMKNAIKKALKIIVPSNSTKKDIIKKFKNQNSKLKVIYEGVPKEFKPLSTKTISQFKKKKKLTSPFLLYIGQWRPHKNLIKLVEAFEIARKETDFQLVIAGKPDLKYKELISKIKKSGYKKDIITPGFIPDEELPLWYNSATAFIFPSLYEGFGLPPLEAMGCGAPVLASKVSSLPEVLGTAALYFNPGNSKAIAGEILKVFKNSNLRKKMSQESLKQVKKFSFEKMAQQTLEVYNTALKH